MDRSDIKRVEVTNLDIVYPDGSPTGMTVSVKDMDSKEVRSTIKKWDRIASRSRKGLSFDQKEEASIELLSAATEYWSGYTDNGVEVECTEEEKRRLYSDPAFRFVRTQVDEHLGEVGNFLSIGSNS